MLHGRFGSIQRWKIMHYDYVHWIYNHKISGWSISHKNWRWFRYIWKLCNCIHACQQCSISRNYHTLNSVLRWTSEQNGFYTDIAVRRLKTWLWLQRFQLQWHQLHMLVPNLSSSPFIIVNPCQQNHIILCFIWYLATILPSLTILWPCFVSNENCAIVSMPTNNVQSHVIIIRWTASYDGHLNKMVFWTRRLWRVYWQLDQ